MIIDNEIIFANINHRETIISWFIKLLITITTIILIGLVVYYHHLHLNFFAAQNSLDDWRAGLTIRKIFLIIFEILICATHPMPRYFPSNWISKHEEIKLNSLTSTTLSPAYITTDVALSLPSKFKTIVFLICIYIFVVFARLYLICRCIIFNSHLVRDARSKSFGSLNKVSINLTFLIKTYLEQWPIRCLIIFCCVIFFIGSWSIRACDYKPRIDKHISMFDSMWLFIITFTTVGMYFE